MGHWQHIPFCVEALKRIGPQSVLDLSIGAGRWSLLVREFCEAREAAVVGAGGEGEGRALRIEGAETTAMALPEHVKSLYDHVHVGTAHEVVAMLPTHPDVIIADGVLHAIEKDAGLDLLRHAVGKASYVLVACPLGEGYATPGGVGEGSEEGGDGSVFERSVWTPADFEAFSVVRKCLLRDEAQRPLGVFLLSRDDPQDVASAPFSADPTYEERGSGPLSNDAVDRALDRVAEQAFEIAFIKKSRTYRLATELRRNPLMRLIARLSGRKTGEVCVEATGEHHPKSQGSEVWLLSAHLNTGEPALPWEFIERRGKWMERHEGNGPYGRCLIATRGEFVVPNGGNPELVFLSHPWSGKVRITHAGRTEEIDLYSERGGRVKVFPHRTPMVRTAVEPAKNGVGPRGTASNGSLAAAHASHVIEVSAPGAGGASFTSTGPATRAMSASQEAFVARVRQARASVVAVHCPRWLGVTNSTRNLFEHLYPVPETPAEEPYHLTEQDLQGYARALLECAADTIVFSGGDEAHYRLMKILKKARPGLRCMMLWHGNYVQLADDYSFKTLKLWMDAARDGRVACVGTVKAGMERFFGSLGVRSKFVMNYIRGAEAPAKPPPIAGTGAHLGLWMSGTLWKTPNVMLAAAKLVEGAKVHAAGVDVRTKELIEEFGIGSAYVSTKPLPFEELMRRMRQTHLTMYVTFTECCPMIPLESFAQGVPAIVGPTSHLFEDDALLREKLVVPFPDRADVIADRIRGVLEAREEIVARYAAYAPGYNERARQSVAALLA